MERAIVQTGPKPPRINEPPKLTGGWAARIPRGWYPVLLFVAVTGAAWLLRLGVYLQVPLPFCLLRKFTGFPCPGCGCTRSLLAWTELDPLAALRLNPLFFAATVGLFLWAGLGWIAPSQRSRTLRWFGPLRALVTPRSLLILAAANWLYLCLTLPK